MRRQHVPMLAAAIMAVLTSGAAAQDRPADWIKRPSLQDLQGVWPSRALKEGYGGKATISCTVTVQGTLRACRVTDETPAGGGFGGAALALSSQFLMKPALKGGAPVETTVSIPINFPRPERATGSHLRPSTDTAFRGNRIYTQLPWRQAPTYQDVLTAYPDKARQEKVGGTAVLDCRIDKDAGISGCKVLNETPRGYGFGAAARGLAPSFLAPADNGRGESLAGDHVHLSVAFAAAALDGGAPVIGKPEWTALPSMNDFTAVIPPAARQAQVYKARVVMQCTVGAEGALADCAVQSEDPAGLGYSDAALTLSRYFRLAVWTDEGLPTVGGKVRIPLRFDLEAAMASKPKP